MPSLDPVEIPAGRLHLRPFLPYDAPAVLAICQDRELSRWTTVPWPYTEQDALDWCGPVTDGMWATGAGAPFAVLDSVSGELVGACGLHRLTGTEAEIGFWTAAAARGTGVTSHAVAALCRWGFAALGLQRIVWRAAVGNWASRGVAEKCGFTVEGTTRRELTNGQGEVLDAWVGTLLSSDEPVDRRTLPPAPVLSDGVVTLRRWRSADAPDVQRACDDALTARWLPVPSPYSLADACCYVDHLTAGQWADGVSAGLAVTDTVDGQLLGAAGLTLRDRTFGVGAVGYWTAPWARGRGVAGRAASLLAQWGLGELGLSRVELLADVNNPASQRAAGRAGFVREGVARRARPDREGAARDMVVFSLVGDGG